MKRFPILLLLIFGMSGLSQAQTHHSFGVSNQSGIYSVFTNPAASASSIYRFSFHAGATSFGVENNFLKSELAYSLLEIGTFKMHREGGSILKDPYFSLSNNQVNSPQIALETEAIGPAFVWGITKNIFVHGYLKERAIGNMDKTNWATVQFLDEKQFRSASHEGSYTMDLRMAAFRETGIGISAVLLEKRQSMIKAGLTYKRLSGRYLREVDVPYFDVNVNESGTNIDARIVERTSPETTNASDFLSFKNPNSIGSGNAFDLGFVYEFRPYRMKSTYRKYQLKGWNTNFKRNEQLKYLYRVSVAVLDLGSIKYDASQIEQNEYLINDDYAGGSFAEMSTTEYLQTVKDTSGPQAFSDAFVQTMPRRLSLAFDRHIYKGMYVSATAIYSLQNANRGQLEYSNSIGLQLRNEGEKWMWMVPLRVVPETKTYTVGGMLKWGPVFFGTNNVRTLFAKKMYDLSLFGGVQFNIPYKKNPTIENFRNIQFLRKQKRNIHGF